MATINDLALELQQLNTNTKQLTDAVNSKMGLLDSASAINLQTMTDAVSKAGADVAAHIATSVDGLPKSNLMFNSPFCGTDSITTLASLGAQTAMNNKIGGAYSMIPQLTLFAGVTLSDQGQFVHNNSTNGGTGAALNQDVIDLLIAMGDPLRRYDQEFHITRLNFDGSNSHAQPLVYSGRCKEESGMFTAAMWVRVSSNPSNAAVVGPKLPTDGQWHFVSWLCSSANLQSWYIKNFPSLGINTAGSIDIALPVLLRGNHVGMTPHITPILHDLES